MNEKNYLSGIKPSYWETCERTDIDGGNSEKRVPICVCLDLAGSMWDASEGVSSMERLKIGIRQFVNDVQKSEQCRSAEIAVVVFVNKGVILQDFTLANSIDEQKIQKLFDSFKPNYDSAGGTERRSGDVEAGIQQALCVLDARKNLYQDYGIPYCQPMLVVMTDGAPTRGRGKKLSSLRPTQLKGMIDEIASRRNSRKLTVISVYCERGTNEDRDALVFLKKLINDNDEVYKINDSEPEGFDKFFAFLSMSVSAASQGKAIDVAKFNAKMGDPSFESPNKSQNRDDDSSDNLPSTEPSDSDFDIDAIDYDDLTKEWF